MKYVMLIPSIALTLLSPKNHMKTAIFPSIPMNELLLCAQPLLNFRKLSLYYVGSIQKIKILHRNRKFKHFF